MHSGPPDRDDPPFGSLWAGDLLSDEPVPTEPHPPDAPPQAASNLPPPSSPPAPAPETASAPWPPPAVPPSPQAREASPAQPSASVPSWSQSAPAARRRRLWPILLGVFVVFDLLVVAGIFVALFAAPGGEDDEAASSRRPGIERPSAGGGEKGRSRGGEAERPTLLSPNGMRDALAEVKRKLGPDAQLQSIRVDRESLQAIARKKLVVVKRDGSSDVLPGPPTIVAPFTLEAVDPSAPSRVEEALTGAGKRLFYTILTGLQYKGGVQWITFAADARNSGFRSDRSGRGLCPLERRC